MSNLSPSRLRNKTSDLTDFFRGAGHSSNQPRHSHSQKDAASINLEVPSGDEMAKKKMTRIPLFGRSRKKSTHSTTSSPFASSAVRESTDTGLHLSRASSAVDRQPSESSTPSRTHPPPLPVPSKAPSRVPTSLSSKFAATFSHSRSSKVTVRAPQTELPANQASSYPSGLVPPESNRSASLESSSSVGTKARATTPRPARPTITVSLSADDDDNEQFKNLFTRSTDDVKRASRTVERIKAPSRQSDELKTDTQPSSSSSPISGPSPIEATSSTSIYKRGHTPASAIAAAVRHQHSPSIGSDRPPSTSSKNSRKNSDSDKSIERIDRMSTPRPSDPRESPRLVGADKEKVLLPSLSRRSTMATGSITLSSETTGSIRSRMKVPSTQGRSRPPTMPLPLLPPSSPPPSSPLPPSPINASTPDITTASCASQPLPTESGTSRRIHVRPRAHTISSSVSVPPSPLSRTFTTTVIPSPTSNVVLPPIDGADLDIDTASLEQLRHALNTRNQQYDELTALVLKMTEQHIAEVSNLEKKIATLEKEARKRDTQIKGFTWLLNDGESPQLQPKPLPAGILNQSRFASSSVNIVTSDSEYEAQRVPPTAPRRLMYQSDSGAESHATSGAESLRASGGSGTESISSAFRIRKLRRPYQVSDSPHGLTRTGTVMRSSNIPPAANSEKVLPEVPYMPTSTTKRSSINSTSVSPSSSTSSLLPPSPSITVSSLSAIPEGSKSLGTLRPPRYDSSSEQQDERRAARASHRTSVSSLTSSSTAASSSYSANIKRSRPPSIAQVLEKTPSNMSEVLEKIRAS